MTIIFQIDTGDGGNGGNGGAGGNAGAGGQITVQVEEAKLYDLSFMDFIAIYVDVKIHSEP